MKVYITVTHGRWPEDGSTIIGVYANEEDAETAGKEEVENNEYGHNQYFVKEEEVQG